MANIVKWSNIDTSNFVTGSLTKNNYGGQQVWLNYKDTKNASSSKLMIQTPMMKAPFGISEYVTDGAVPKYTLDTSFQDNEPFLRMIETIDNFLIEKGVTHSQEWFGKLMSEEVIRELYRPLIKLSKQPERYAPTMKFKVLSRTKGFSTDGEAMDVMTDITKGSMVKMIFSLSPVWFVNKQFGVSCTIEQICIKPNEQINNFVFEED